MYFTCLGFKEYISLVLPRQTISFAGLSQYIETCPLGVLVDSVEEDLVHAEINGTQDVYVVQRIAISNYAAKELCGPIAYTTGRNRRLAAYRLEKASRRDEEISQLFDDGRTSR